MNGNWTEIAPDNLERMIAHVKSNGYADQDDAIRVDFDDFCNLLRRLQEQSVKTRAAYEAGEIAMKEKAAAVCELGNSPHIGCLANSPEGNIYVPSGGTCHVAMARAIRALPLSGAEAKEGIL